VQQKIPFLTLLPEIASIPAWGAGSLVQMVSTIQSSQTAHFVGDSKEAVSAGISPVASPARTKQNSPIIPPA
jgi:hypothetical protein